MTIPVKVVIVDDHEAVAQGLRALMEDEPDIDVVALAAGVTSAMEMVERHRPEVLLVDYRLPDGSGAELARAASRLQPPPAVVMISANADRRVLGQALDAGCLGFVSKNADRADLIEAVRSAATGESYFTRDMLRHLTHLRRFDQVDAAQLADREIEVLQLVTDGLSIDEIAERLYLSPHTVKNHLRHAMTKLGAHTKLEAVVKAFRARLISIDS